MIREAAILQDGRVYTGHRHAFIIHMLADMGFPTPIRGQQGFVTHDGFFVSRKDAMLLSLHCGQVTIEKMHMPFEGLDSSDLY